MPLWSIKASAMLRRLLPVLALAGLLIFVQRTVAQDDSQQGVNFQQEVAPIFARHCLECHGTNDPRGGLQLTSREAAEFGGDTMLPVIGGTLETNEVYLRVSSDDMTYRMPKGAPPLSASEVDTIRRWVEAGTPWVDPQTDINEEVPADEGSPLLVRLTRFLDWGESLSRLHPYRYQWLIAALVIQLMILVIERVKRTQIVEEPAKSRLANWATRIRWEHYSLIWMAMLIALLVPMYHTRIQNAEQMSSRVSEQVNNLKQKVDELEGRPSTVQRYGDPPIPPRPEHPAALSHVYYRGNCERNDELFNNGNYRTAEFHVSLRDTQGQLISIGDPVPGDGLVIHFELHRSPGTTPALFTEQVISSVFLSETIYKTDKQPTNVPEDVMHLTTLNADWKWSADYPIPDARLDGQLAGMIYVNKGRVASERVTAIPHYGIRYSLQIHDGRLDEGSEVWMGCLFQSPAIAVRQTNKVPFNQWFDHNPLPIIEGENTSDPTLLGIPEHVKGDLGETPDAALKKSETTDALSH